MSSRLAVAVRRAGLLAGLFADLPAQFVQRALRDEPAAGDDADAIGHALGDLQDMRGHDDGAAGLDVLAQHGLDLAGGAGIEAGERLVEDDELGLVHQRAGQRHFLAHAFREAFAAFIGVRSETRASR